MKRQWQRNNLTKAILVVAGHILAMVLAVSIVWVMLYPSLWEGLLEGNPAKQYEESSGFVSQMENHSAQVMNGIRAAELLETEGELDENKSIDVEDFYQSTTISGKNESGLAYKLGDLINWGDELARDPEKYENYGESIIVCRQPDGKFHYYRYSDFATLIDTGDLQFSWENADAQRERLSNLEQGYYQEGMEYGVNESGEEESTEIHNADGDLLYVDYWNYDGYSLREAYAPEGADSILDIVNENADWNGRLSEAFTMLRDAVDRINVMYSEYIVKDRNLQEGDTNYQYIFVDTKTKKVYTNRDAYRNYGQLEQNLATLKEAGKYIIVKPKLSDFESNIGGISAEGWRDQIKYSGDNEDHFVFAAAVDTEYPILDVFHSENEIYAEYGSSVRDMVVVGVIAGVLLLVSLIWLTMIAGRRAEDDELHLCWFDRWKTEIAAAVIILLGLIPMMLISSVGYTTPYNGWETISYNTAYLQNSVPYLVLGAVVAGMTYCFFLIGYLSLVRRIKAKTLWKNSLLRWLCGFIYKLFSNIHCVWKVILIFGGFAIVHWIAVAAMSGPWVLLMLAVEAAAFIYLVYEAIGKEKLKKGISKISQGEVDYKIPTEGLRNDQRVIAERINSIGEGLDAALEESMKSERLKTDLITNVSHDIKTPLTSIINYVDLLKKENFDDPKIQRYLEILESKAQRLKTLTEDVVEASKVSSGNITLEYMNLNFIEMIQQTSGEFEEKFKARDLTEVLDISVEEAYIRADGRRTWRILENIYNNAAKYAMEGTRIYADLRVEGEQVIFSLKNISQQPLNISADELTERFIRGDISRSTEGSGLGLSIAQTLTQMQGGKFELYVDGDLFKVTITFPKVKL